MSRSFIVTLSLAAFLALCACTVKSMYDPAGLTTMERDSLMWKVIRFVGRPPDGNPGPERFGKEFNAHYLEQISLHKLEAYYRAEDGREYFLMSRRAPSLSDKWVATGGVCRIDGGSMTDYEEMFRTWKMVPDTLTRRSLFLFDKMVKEEDLTPYYSSNSGNTDYIEFPDDRVYFDKTERSWKMKDSVNLP